MDSVMKSLPMVALRGLTIMPEMVVHFDVSRERSITAVQQAMMEDQKIFLVAQKSIETEDPDRKMYTVSEQLPQSGRSLNCRRKLCGFLSQENREED